MSDTVNKGMIKMAVRLIGPDKIKEGIAGLFSGAIQYKKDYQLLPGETDLIGILYEVDGIIYFASAAIDDHNKMLRIENVTPLDQLADKLLNSL